MMNTDIEPAGILNKLKNQKKCRMVDQERNLSAHRF